MPAITGKDGLVTTKVGAGAHATIGLLREWERTIEETNIDTSAQGDDWESSVHHRKRWSVRATYVLPESGMTSKGATVGTTVEVALKVIDTEVTAFFTGTGRVESDVVRAPEDNQATGDYVIRGVGAPTIL